MSSMKLKPASYYAKLTGDMHATRCESQRKHVAEVLTFWFERNFEEFRFVASPQWPFIYPEILKELSEKGYAISQHYDNNLNATITVVSVPKTGK